MILILSSTPPSFRPRHALKQDAIANAAKCYLPYLLTSLSPLLSQVRMKRWGKLKSLNDTHSLRLAIMYNVSLFPLTTNPKNFTIVNLRLHLNVCLNNLYNHSRFHLIQNAGARFTLPANTSKLPPTPIKIPLSQSGIVLAINFSCFGNPSATKIKSASDSTTRFFTF